MSLASILLVLAACEPRVENRGFVRAPEAESAIKVGEANKGDVLQALGSPSSRSNFGPESWYYISGEKKSIAFMAPEITEQDVLRIEFDSAGLVSKVERYGLKDAKPVAMVERTTPTEGHSLGVMEQLLGNMGRFNKPAGRSETPRGVPVPGGR